MFGGTFGNPILKNSCSILRLRTMEYKQPTTLLDTLPTALEAREFLAVFE